MKETKGTLPDEEIVSLYWGRRESAIRETDRKYGRYLWTVAYNLLRDDEASGDALNDTYLGAWNAIPPTRPKVLPAFLARITRNVSVSMVRKKTAAGRVPSELVVSLEELEGTISLSEGAEEEICAVAEVLNDYLATLSRRKVFVFVCRYYYADPLGRIASMLGIGESSVRRDLAQIRRGLMERLKQEGVWYE